MANFRFDRRRAMWIVAGCLVLSVSIISIYEYFHDIIWVRLKLLRVDRINQVRLYGYDDLHYHVHSISFGIVGKPGSAIRIGVSDTNQGLTGNPEHLYLQHIGPWELRSIERRTETIIMTTEGPEQWSAEAPWIDIGPKGEFGAMLPVHVGDINDLVAHYDELVRFFGRWLDEEHKRGLVFFSGKRVDYYRERGNPYATTQ